MVHCCDQRSPWATSLLHVTHALQPSYLCTSGGQRNILHILVVQGIPSFSGTGQTEVGWSVSAAGSPVIMKLTSHMVVPFPLPNGS